MSDQSTPVFNLPTEALEATPLHLLNTDPLELEDVPLQVALLTMEVAQLRETVRELVEERDGRRTTTD